MQFPFKSDIDTTSCGDITLKMAELQADNEAKINFDVFQDVAKFLDTVIKQAFNS